MSFFNELKRRNVIKVAAAYVIIGWLIMQAGDTLAPALHLPEWVNSMLAFFLLLGFPLAMFFAWAFEMTPEGLKKEKDVDHSQSITRFTGQKLNYTIIVLLVAALGYIAYDKLGGSGSLSPETSQIDADDPAEKLNPTPFQTIAVLPFVNMSEDASNEYFSDGLTEELLNILSKIKELRVAGRTSSFAFKGKDEDLRVIGEKLNVRSILEGSVRKDDKRNRVRITTQLINVEDGYQLWSETYDRELDDIFTIQEEIAREVAQALRITLLGEDEARLEQHASTQISAYDFYLQGLQGINDGGFASLNRATDQFQQALALDPAYIPARLGLVSSWTALASTGAITRNEAVKRGLPLLKTILAEQPGNPDAQVLLAMLRVNEGDDEAAAVAFISALKINSRNLNGLREYGRFLFDRGHVKQGMELIAAALEIEPYSVQVLWDQCATNAYLQNVDPALTACARIQEITPDSPLGWYGLNIVHDNNGDLANAMKNFAEAIKRDPKDFEMLVGMCMYWLTLGDHEQASQWLQRAEAIGAGQPFPIFGRMNFYLAQEQYNLASELARRALEQDLEDRYGTNAAFRRVLAFNAREEGNYQATLEPFRKAFPWAFQSPLEAPPDAAAVKGDIIQIAALLKLANPTSEQTGLLLDLVEETVDQFNPRAGLWTPDLTRAAIATIRGDHETALTWLESAWDKHWRFAWRNALQYSVVFSQLKNEPGFQQLVARFEDDMESQREEAYVLMGITK